VTAERPGGKGWRRELQSQGVNPALLDLLESCWDDTSTERPANAGELLARLDRETPPPPTVPPFPPLRVDPPATAKPEVKPPKRSQTEPAPEKEPARGMLMTILATLADIVPGGGIVSGNKMAIILARVVVVILMLVVGGAITYWAWREEGAKKSATAMKTPDGKGKGSESSEWSIAGSWNPTDMKLGVQHDNVYRFMSDGSATNAIPGLKAPLSGQYRLTADTLEITWDGEPTTTYDIRTKDAVMLVLGERPSKTNPNPALAVTWKRADKSGSGK